MTDPELENITGNIQVIDHIAVDHMIGGIEVGQEPGHIIIEEVDPRTRGKG
jgi:hypothetical protein